MHQHKRALEEDEACVSPQPLKFLKQMRDEESVEVDEVVDVVPEGNHYKVAAAPQCTETKREEEAARENSSSQEHSGLDVQECASSPAPRVWETILPPARRLVRIDPSCQAEVPAWDPDRGGEEAEDDSSYYLGQRVWPRYQSSGAREDDEERERFVGRGRRIECECEESGSIECVRRHVDEERRRVAAELGPAFRWMGMEEMGDVVAEKWSEEEQRLFKSLVMMNPGSQHRDFWAHLRVAFPRRSSRELVSYYFNVFMLRRRALQNRFYPQDIDSDFDEGDLSDDELEFSDSDEPEPELQHQQVLFQEGQGEEDEDEEQEDDSQEQQQQGQEEDEEEDDEEDEDDEGGLEVSERYGDELDESSQACRRDGVAEEHEDEKRMSFTGTEDEIMRLATLGGDDSWLPPSSSLELTSTNGAMQEIFGGGL